MRPIGLKGSWHSSSLAYRIANARLCNVRLGCPRKARLDAMELHLNDYGIIPLHGSGTTNPKNWLLPSFSNTVVEWFDAFWCQDVRTCFTCPTPNLDLTPEWLRPQVRQGHESHGGTCSCASVPYLSCCGQQHWSEGVCGWLCQLVPWLARCGRWCWNHETSKDPGIRESFWKKHLKMSWLSERSHHLRYFGTLDLRYQSYNHFGAGDIPMSQDRYNTLTQQSHRMVSWLHVVVVLFCDKISSDFTV